MPRTYSGPGRARPATALADINNDIRSALYKYKKDNGSFPKSLQDLAQQPADAKNWHGSYLGSTNLPIDPWGDPFIYEYPGRHNPNGYDLSSAGLDGKPGTDDDIVNWTR